MARSGERAGQGRKTKLVVAAAVRAIVSAAAIGPHAGGVGCAVRRGNALQRLIVVVDQIPDGTLVSSAVRGNDRLRAGRALLACSRLRDRVVDGLRLERERPNG